MRKKIVTLGPVMPHEADIAGIANTLAFLEQDYQLDYIDPLARLDELANDDYYRLWEIEIAKRLDDYDIFFGFSFGGVILQQCFSLFAGLKKKIVLFSTPTFADKALKDKLGQVIQRCEQGQVVAALNYLYDCVFHPNPSPLQFSGLAGQELVAKRLNFGLKRVLETDSTKNVCESSVDHLHLLGEYSDLVNLANVHSPTIGQLMIVPAAGMRVLQDNPAYCQAAILQWLNPGNSR